MEPQCTIVKEYGVLHLRGALGEEEQLALLRQIASDVKSRPPANPIPANFHLSSGDAGSVTRREPLHELGKLLYQRFADEVAKQLSPTEVAAEPSMARIARVHSGEQPVNVNHVSGVCYQAHSVLANHQDGPKALYTMSVALGCACDFVVGARPATSAGRFKNLRSGAPATLRMESGDAIFFDGGSIPHAIPTIHKGTAPPLWHQALPKGFGGARVSVLFREPDGWDAKYMG